MKTSGFAISLFAGVICAGALSATPAGAVIAAFGGDKTPGVDPLADAYSTNVAGKYFSMGPEAFNTGALTLGDGSDRANVFRFTLNNGVVNGLEMGDLDTFLTDITTGQTWNAVFSTIAGVSQRVEFTAPGGAFLKPGDIFQVKIDFVTPLDTKRYSWSANWDNTVPEPTTWALMIAGFGLAGATLRRRRMLPA
jgi:hypothetical protein